MTYENNLEKEGIKAGFLAVLRPARRVESWTLYTGSVYYNLFDFGHVYKVEINGVALTEAFTPSLSAGQFYWDFETETLYVRASDSADPDTHFVVVTYELYFGTISAHWNRIPTDETSRVVYFDPIIESPPAIKDSIKDVVYGFRPVQQTAMRLSNAEHSFEKHLYDSSFFNKEILIYHLLGEIESDAFKLVMKGIMTKISYSSGQVSISIYDGNAVFENEFRSIGEEFYNTTLYPNLNPAFQGKPIRSVLGAMVDGFVPVNVSFVRDNPTTSNNRTWAVRSEGASGHALTATVPASPASTTTRTQVNSAQGFRVGDSVWIDKTTDEYVFVTAVHYGTDPYIEHAALVSGAAATGNTVKRGTVGNVEIISQGQRFRAHYNRDYTETVDANGVLNFVFSSSLESNLSMPQTLSSSDNVLCRVYGKKNTLTLGGNPYGSNHSQFGNQAALPCVLYDLLKTYHGFAESELNLTSFTDLLASVDDAIGMAVPEKATDSYPKLKNVLIKILQSGLVKLFIDDDLKWKVSVYEPISSFTKEVTSNEIIDGQVDYSFEGQDISSNITVSYAFKELTESALSASGATTSGLGFSKALYSSDTAKYLHGASKGFSVESLHLVESEALRLARRLSYVLGDRQGTLGITVKNRFFDETIDAKIRVTTPRLPGFEFDSNTDRSRDLCIEGSEKSLRNVKLSLSDQKGAQDNSGSW